MTRRNIFQGLTMALLLIVGFLIMFPLLLALNNSFKTNGQLLTNVLSLPQSLYLDNYARSVAKMHYLRSLGNTLFLSLLGVALMSLFSAMAGWKLCRTQTRLSRFFFALFIFSMLIPFNSVMIPLYRVVSALGLRNSLTGLSLIYAGLGSSMAIFIYHGFVQSLPSEVEESAMIDGASSLQIFLRVVFPMLSTVTATIFITNVLWIWNDFLLPLIVLSDNKKYTLLLSTNTLFGQYSSDWTAILSALLLAAIPAIMLFVLFQKQIVQGIATGAVKG